MNKKDIEKRIEVVKEDSVFRLHYDIPTVLKPTFDILIEEDIGYDDNLILSDVADEVINDKLVGYVEVEVNGKFDYDTIFGRASQLDMLSKGEDLISEV